MDIKEFDVIKTKDGRIGAILHCYPDGKAFEIEYGNSDGDAVTTELSEIESVVWKAPTNK